MGNQPSHQIGFQNNFQRMACQDDLTCKHIDEKLSTVDHLVLDCPLARCNSGTCSCGPGCELDPYMGVCCSHVEKKVMNGQMTTFCIENPLRHVNIPTPLPKVGPTIMPALAPRKPNFGPSLNISSIGHNY